MPSSYFGYIMKVNAECGKGHRKKRFCVVFKAKGTHTCKCNYFQILNLLPNLLSMVSISKDKYGASFHLVYYSSISPLPAIHITGSHNDI